MRCTMACIANEQHRMVLTYSKHTKLKSVQVTYHNGFGGHLGVSFLHSRHSKVANKTDIILELIAPLN